MHALHCTIVAIMACCVSGADKVIPLVCPVSIADSCPDNKNMQFVLFTRHNPVEGQVLIVASDNIAISNFNPANPTKIIIHGFTESITSRGYPEMKQAYLKKGDYNVIMVDWSYLAKKPLVCYPTAAYNIRHVGKCTAGLVQLLRNKHQVEDIHIVGHSLGAQTAHFIAKNVDRILPRITGLDPAGPGFYDGVYVKFEMLKETDAVFVDVIHTDSEGFGVFGTMTRMGNVDFYMNDGTDQPGCEKSLIGLPRTVCNHHRSIEFFTESIYSATGFYGNRCADIDDFKRGRCSTASPRTVLMGENALPTTKGVVAVPTGSQSPYALGP